MNFASKAARTVQPATDAAPERGAAISPAALATASQAVTPAALAAAAQAERATSHVLTGLARTRALCDVRPGADAFAAHASLATRRVEAAMRLYNGRQPIPADLAHDLVSIVGDRHLDEAHAAEGFQRGLTGNPSSLADQASALLTAARKDGLAPAA